MSRRQQFEVSSDRLDKLYNLTHEDERPKLPDEPNGDSRRHKSSRRTRSRSPQQRRRRQRSKDADEKREKKSKDGPGRFRFKKKRRKDGDGDDDDEDLGRGRKRRNDDGPRRHHHHRDSATPPATLPPRYDRRERRRRRSRSRSRDYIRPREDFLDDDTIENSARLPSPDTAFRESLFDAMADDEGAAFWETVYGQPIHTYARPSKPGERGELEMMDDDEYAEYVRRKMWEKTHEHVVEERRRREEERARRREREEKERGEWEELERERLRREKTRREKRDREKFAGRWDAYVAAWTALLGASARGAAAGKSIPWPVPSGRMRDVEPSAVQAFLLSAIPDEALLDTLKAERVRWHPDKIQQRLGALGEEVMRAVTAVFQAVDGLWNERRE